ncbi:MAG: hypothetical protein VR70_13730 [Rhodospirillaceae bacterium BRH_c57]|nr:MAG: hypothetical protein VR70_13730 [Rhodospirillaceae bacterium BRH_c57]
MSVTGKTLGVVLIGLVGLLAYVGVYVAGAFAQSSGLALGVAQGAIMLGLFLTASLLVIIVILTANKSE